MIYLAVFVALFALDFIYARYNVATTTGRALASAHYAALIILLGGFGIVQYAHDPLMLIPAAFGAWGGTFCAVHFKKESVMKHAKGWTVYRIKNRHARRAVLALSVMLFLIVLLVGVILAFGWNIARAAWAAVAATFEETRTELKGCGTAVAKAWRDFD
jgi:hypothetical protein